MHVAPDSPAQRAGVRVGDTITGLDEHTLKTTKEVIDALSDKIGQRVTVQLQRGEQRVGASCQVESMQQ